MSDYLPFHDHIDESLVLQFPQHQDFSMEASNCLQEGIASLQMGDPAKALPALQRAVEVAPHMPEARICLGLAYALTHDIYPAIDSLEKAGTLDPHSFAAHYTLAQLNFKLRIPKKGYESAQSALRCITNIEQRKMLTQLLREERARERNGIARPTFDTPFNKTLLVLTGSGLAAAVIAFLIHVS